MPKKGAKAATPRPRGRNPGRKPGKTAPSPVVAPPVAVVPQPHGGALNRGGTFAGAGRPTNEFKALCRGIVSREETLKEVAAILNDRDHRHFMAALEWASRWGFGHPDKVGLSPREQLLAALRELSTEELERLAQLPEAEVIEILSHPPTTETTP